MKRLHLALGAGLLSSCSALPHDGSAVTAQRPTLSSDTATTAEGTFELEAGVVYDPDDVIDTPLVLKYGSGPATEVFLGWSPYLDVDEGGVDDDGIGDLAVGVRHRLRDESDSAPSSAVQATVKLPTADEDDGLGTGEVDASFAGIVTKTIDQYVVTGYYSLDVLGDPGGNADIGHSLALASTLPMNGRIGGFGEVAGVFVPEEDFEPVFATVGLTYNPDSWLVFDVGLLVGLNEDAPDVQLLFGFTQNLGRPRWRR